MKKLFPMLIAIALVLSLVGCESGDNDNNGDDDGIKWDTEPNGTIEIINNSSKDVILFRGEVPTDDNILGGVRASKERTFDISTIVNDFESGGYMIIQGISLDEYNNNKSNFYFANIRYEAIIPYKQGVKFRTAISSSCFGDYCFRVNNGNTQIELRMNSPEGEKIGYIPRFARNYTIYTNSSDILTVFPVYISFNTETKSLVYYTPPDSEVTVTPCHTTDSNINIYSFSDIEGD
jgi:hypothetical protein